MNNKESYRIEEIKELTKNYFGGDELATDAWIKKYSLKDSDGNIYERTPDDMHKRIASEISRIESKYPNPLSYETFYESLKDYKYIIPQGSPMSGIGNNFQTVSLSNCFVIGNDGFSDSYGAILKIDQEQIQLMKRRGGVGHDLSHIRPRGSKVNNSALTSTGIVPFMERFSNSTREVSQDGRRGALMLSCDISHPDVEDFIDAKLLTGKVTGANISVKISDEFMEVVKRTTDEDILEYKKLESSLEKNSEDADLRKQFETLKNRITYTQIFEFVDKTKFTKEIIAKELWKKIINNAWASAEPGILFWDMMIRESLGEHYFEHGFANVSTNPCGELLLPPEDSCRLVAMNLYSFVKNPFTKEATFDFSDFAEKTKILTRMMDNIIDLELEKIESIIKKIEEDPESEEIKMIELNLWKRIKEKCFKGRRTGIGITAEGDMLAALNLRYGTPEATLFAENVHSFYAIEVLRESVNLAKERGAFPIFDYEKEKGNPFIERIRLKEPKLVKEMESVGRRNIALLTIAPTGCLVGSTVIVTDKGNISLESLFEEHGYTLKSLEGKSNVWLELKFPVFVYDVYGELHPILKLYYNGKSETKKIKFSDGSSVESTKDHKFLVKADRDLGTWVKAEDLKPSDKLVRLENLDFKELEILEIEDSFNETMDIEVEETHYYTLKNGIVSHNTVSTQTQTTSGIEPAFMVYYTRRRKINPREFGVRVDFVDELGDQWTEYNVFHHKFIDWFLVNSKRIKDINFDSYDKCKEYLEKLDKKDIEELIEVSPYYKAMANDVDWVEKVRMQGAIQKWVDHSISCCLTSDSLVRTNEGLFYLDELVDFSSIPENEFQKNETCDFKVTNHENKLVNISSFYNNGTKEIWKTVFANGLELNSTFNEKVLVYNQDTNTESWCMVKDLKVGDLVKLGF